MTIVNDFQYMKFNQGYEYCDALTPAESDYLFPRMLNNLESYPFPESVFWLCCKRNIIAGKIMTSNKSSKQHGERRECIFFTGKPIPGLNSR